MKYLYLPGFSPLNRNELVSFKDYFYKKGEVVTTHEWRHWSDESLGSNGLDLEAELKLILGKVTVGEEYTLLAKSIGTLVGMALNPKMKFKKIVLMGVPTGSLKGDDSSHYSNVGDSEVFIFQNEKDPYGPIEKVYELIPEDKSTYTLIEADNHLYDIPELVFDALRDDQ